MFAPLATPRGHVWWRSPQLHALGVPHAFLSRAWNVQTPDHARRAADDLGLPPGPIHLGAQCHGAAVTTPRHRPPRADAHVTDQPHDYVAVRTADCVPILLASAQGRCVAAVHAGWRGLVAGVIDAAAHAMREQGAPPAVAAIGPCIGVDAYEVGPEVAAHFDVEHLVHPPAARPHLDLRRAASAQLVAAGLTPDTIDISTACTHRDAANLFSYRRAQQQASHTGHQAAVIAPAAM